MQAVLPLRNALMGTETVAPLLYHLVRLTRPRRILEVGMGYTTPFLAQALVDNEADFAQDHQLLSQKTEPTLLAAERDGGVIGTGAYYEWLHRAPAYAAPAHYQQRYEPRLVAFDNLSESAEVSTASLVEGVLDALDLRRVTTVHHRDIFEIRTLMSPRERQFDLFFSDGAISPGLSDSGRDFFEEFWDLVSPDGGLFVAQALGTTAFTAQLLARFKAMQASTHANDFELVNLFEPHKLSQTGLFILRRTSSKPLRIDADEHLEDAVRFMTEDDHD